MQDRGDAVNKRLTVKSRIWICSNLVILIMACNVPSMSFSGVQADVYEDSDIPISVMPTEASQTLSVPPEGMIGRPPSDDVLMPDDLEYLGAFRLPEESGGSNWEYSGRGLTFYPDGDPSGAGDGFPGSLFGVGHDHQEFVSEINIPAPVISRNLEDLPTAKTLQPFSDITSGMFGETELPRLGLEYLPPQDAQTTGKLHFVHGQHFQDFEPSHGWSELDLARPVPVGPWTMNGYTNYVTSDYIFEIPENWASALPGNPRSSNRAFP